MLSSSFLRARAVARKPSSIPARVVLLIFACSLQACMWSPGMKMKTDGSLSDVSVPVMKDGKVTTEKVKIVPITAELLIARENLKRQRAAIPSVEPVDTTYRVGPHDRLEITFWEHPELNDPGGEKILPELAGKVVKDDGTLFYPYVGNVPVAGKTVAEVRDMLTQGLSKYFKKVKLDVRVISFLSHRVYVVGEVKNPGIQSMVDTPLTVAEAVSRAGGATEEADLSSVTLSRGDKLYPIDLLALYEQGNNAQNVFVKDGDVINVPDRRDNKVFVMGEVGRQTPVQINKGKLTLQQALLENGVDFNSSKPEDIYVIRGAQAQPEIFHLNAESPDALILADRFSLQPHDVVFVGTAGITRWSRVMNQLLPNSMTQMMTRGAFYGM
jgi:polysaccharide export outer membrane protein